MSKRNFLTPGGLIFIRYRMVRRRALPILAALGFALQFVLLASGWACTARSAGDSHGMSAADMDMGSGASTPSRSSGHHRPCDTPSPAGGCHAMAPCILSLLATLPRTWLDAAAPPQDAVVLIVLAPLSRTTAPEPPPPKA